MDGQLTPQATDQPQASQSQQPLSVDQSKPKFPFLAALLFLTLGGIGGFVVSKIVSKPAPATQPASTLVSLPPTPITNPMADWKTYTDRIHKIEFQYPESSESLVQKNTLGQDYLIIDSDSSFGIDDSSIKDCQGKKGENCLGMRPKIDREAIVHSNSIIFEKIYTTPPEDQPWPQGEVPQTIYVETNLEDGKVATFIFGVNNRNNTALVQSTEKKIDQILSTFKFLDQNSNITDTTNWKTYENTEYGFSYQYPQDWLLSSEPDLFAVHSDTDKASIQTFRYQLSDLPKGYSSVAEWFEDLKDKKQKALLPNDGYYYGPGSDNPFKWYMYYDANNIKDTILDTISSVVTSNTGTGLLYIVVPTKKFIYEIVVNPIKAYESPSVSQILSTFKFLK